MDLTKIDVSQLLEEVSKRGFISTKRELNINRHYQFPKEKKPFKIGVVGDTHLGSQHQQITLLNKTYDEFKKQGIKDVLHVGDLVEGNGKLFKGQEYEMFLHGADSIVDYAIEVYPKRKGITTYIIGGSHDYSFYKSEGIDILKKVSEKRKDIKYLGMFGAFLKFGDINIYLMHGESGNAYARSYRMQKIIEQFAPAHKPNILLLGHYHTTALLPNYRGVAGFQLPCFQTQTQYLRAKGLSPEVGYVILEIFPDQKGIAHFKPDFKFFYDCVDGDF